MLAAVTSHSKYSVQGCLRIGAQILSQEMIIGSTTLIILLALNTLSQSELMSRQFDLLLILPLFSLYLSYLLSIVSETTRSPFDLVEAESELVGGWATEYPGIYFSLFFMAEYCNVIALSSLASIYFFSQLSIVFSLLPSFIHISSLVNVRSSFPRYRQDQLMFQC